jgi:hypothetical protein
VSRCGLVKISNRVLRGIGWAVTESLTPKVVNEEDVKDDKEKKWKGAWKGLRKTSMTNNLIRTYETRVEPYDESHTINERRSGSDYRCPARGQKELCFISQSRAPP